MVISVKSPETITRGFPPASRPVTPVTEEISTERHVKPSPNGLDCARCGTRMLMGYDEPQCLNCGYADYSRTNTTTPQESKSIVSTATRFVLRYVGDFPSLGDTLMHVRLERLRNRVVYAVTCPFCENIMDESSLSGKRPEVREQRHKCIEGHRVSLVPGKNGMMGWR